jgi:hypothetical protein
VEQVSGKQNGIWVLLEDEFERRYERVCHVILTLFQTVLSVAKMDVGQMCDVHVFEFDWTSSGSFPLNGADTSDLCGGSYRCPLGS